MSFHHHATLKPLTLSCLLGFTLSNAQAVVTYGLDEVVTINTTINDFIRANRNSQLTFETGADIQGTNGADVTVLATQTSTITINDGNFINDVVSTNNSTITINGGLLGDDLIADLGGIITVNGGTIDDDVEVFTQNSSISIFGGTFREDIEASQQSTIAIRGGSYDSDFSRIRSANNSTITIYGSDFFIEGSPVTDGVISEEFGTLTGTLSDGTFLDVFFDQNPSQDFSGPLGNAPGTIVLVTVPEPSTITLIFGTSILLLKRRNRLS